MEHTDTAYRFTFQRYEKKYLVSAARYAELRAVIDQHTHPDEFGRSTICNLYFDTPDYRLIRSSIEKPVYKEKLRLRCYGTPHDDTVAFLEIKKKYNGLVSKRRVAAPLADIMAYLQNGTLDCTDPQILAEIDRFFVTYPGLAPRAFIASDRIALFGDEDWDLRITFDENLRYRGHDLDLRRGPAGRLILDPQYKLMEVKVSDAMPLWLTHALDDFRLYPVSYSKYGSAYQKFLLPESAATIKGGFICA